MFDKVVVPFILVIALGLVSCSKQGTRVATEPPMAASQGPISTGSRPNILLIVADDLGYTDLGAFGGEINTPTLDRLATEGVRLANFYVAPSCSPTRAQLLSGVDNHLAGLGTMKEFLKPWQEGKPGYEGYLNHRVDSVATLLQNAGYRTYMTGKWHLGLTDDTSPHARGFDRSFSLLHGTSGHFDNTAGLKGLSHTLFREDRELVPWPEGKFSSDHYADKLIEYLQDDQNDETPFFAYLAFTAPHFPMHAPDEDIRRYVGHYHEGYEAVRAARITRMRELGLISGETIDSVVPAKHRAWNTLSAEEQALEARAMQVYAAMIDNMDRNVERVLEQLRRSSKLQNTLVIFMSDNGPDPKDLGKHPMFAKSVATMDNSLENIGRPGSFKAVGAGWAYVSAGPFRLYKHLTSQGGIRVPAFIWHTDSDRKGEIDKNFLTVRDIAPTLLEMAGVERSSNNDYRSGDYVMAGRSLLPLLASSETMERKNEVFAWEHRGRRGIIQGDWKGLLLDEPYGTGKWELFNLKEDPGEAHNLASENPKKIYQLAESWDLYANSHNVLIKDAE